MTTQFTTNFRLPIPDFNSEPWHAQVQSLFQQIDALVYKVLVANGMVTWVNLLAVNQGTIALDPVDGSTWLCRVSHTNAAAGNFAAERVAHPTYWSAFAISFNPRGVYTNNTTYSYYDLVYDPTLKIIALCTTAYTSGAGPANLNTEAANWAFLAVFPVSTTAASISYDHTTSGLVAITVQAALDEIVVDLLAYETSNNAAVALKAPIASPTFTGTPAAPTPSAADNTTKLATTAFVATAITNQASAAGVVNTANVAAAAITIPKLALDTMRVGMLNGTIVESHAGGGVTFAIKTTAGTDPSAADPTLFSFRNASAGSGSYTNILVTAALSVTFPTGSTFGVFATANTPFRLWLMAYNNAGAVGLAVMNCLSQTASVGPGTNLSLSTLRETGIVNIIGTSAIAAQIMYGSAAANVPYEVIGSAGYEAGLAVNGVYGVSPTTLQLHNPGSPLPGQPLGRVYTITNSSTSIGASGIATNNTATINMSSAANLVKVETIGTGRMGAGTAFASVRRGSSVQVGAGLSTVTTGPTAAVVPCNVNVLDFPGVSGNVTYTVYCSEAGVTWTYIDTAVAGSAASMELTELVA